MSLDFQIVSGTDLLVEVTARNQDGTLYDSLDTASDIVVKVSTSCGTVIEKSFADGVVVTAPSEFSFPLVPSDTVGKSGTFQISALITAMDGKIYPLRNEDLSPGSMQIIKS